MSRSIAVVSGKGGVGKTATSANLALALQEFGENVVAVDCDQAASNLAIQLDLHQDPDNNLQKALRGERNVIDTIHIHNTGLLVMPSSHLMKEEIMTADELERIVDRINGTVVIDSPPGLGENVHTILDVVDDILLVTNPEIPAVTDAMKLSEVVKAKRGHKDDIYTVINKANETGSEVNHREIEMALETPIASKIPYDKDLKASIHEQEPVIKYSPYSKSAIEYRKLAAWMLGREYEPPKLAPVKRFFNRMGRR